MSITFRALQAEKASSKKGGVEPALSSDPAVNLSIVERSIDQLPEGEVLIKVHYSALNYKDALSAAGHTGITRHYPHTPGIDAAGVIEMLSDQCGQQGRLAVGDEVIVTGFDLGMNTSGGFAEYIRVPAEWVVKKPSNLSMEASMMLGTAGLTAAMAVDCLLQVGITPNFGDIVVTGASGGVGCIALMLLQHLQYSAVAVTGKPDMSEFLSSVGAAEVLDREQFIEGAEKPILKERWGGAIDTLGGKPLMTLLKGVKYGGSVACCGMAASPDFAANVYPFILRGVNLLGVDSVNLPLGIREEMWAHFASDWTLPQLKSMVEQVSLEELPEKIQIMLAGGSRGRVVVSLSS